ncbi:MAG TPA: hypothetical protein VMO00_02700 [Methylomirabilota bacterium]|nr:hypothetical protein [Methylomirabilota bacterium]
MSQIKSPVYILSGVADYRPPQIWEDASTRSDTLQEYWESGKLEPLYSESLLWTGFEKLIAEAAGAGIELAQVKTINVAISYPRELAQMSEDEVREDFLRRLKSSPLRDLFKQLPKIRFTPTHAASSSGMVPFNDALDDVLTRGEETSIVITAGNTKGTNRNRPRISADETTDIFASLISPFDRKYTGANMLKLGAAALGRACQHDSDLLKALEKFAYDQRLFTHQLARQDLSTAHITSHPDTIKNQTIFYPLKLLSVAPQSLGYGGLILSRQQPATGKAVRIVGLGCGVDPSSIRDRKNHLFSNAMASSVRTAFRQAQITNLSDLKILEHHNPFPAVPLTELEIILNSLDYRGSVSEALLLNDVGVNGRLIRTGRSGGAMSGHGITPTFIRLAFEASKGLLGAGGYPSLETSDDRVAYAGISSVGGHHTFDGYVVLAGGKTDSVAKIETSLEPFDHDHYNRRVERDLEEQKALKGVIVPHGMTVAFISYRETRIGREYFGIAQAPDGRDFPFSASRPLFESLDASRYAGCPIRISPTLHGIEGWKGVKLQQQSFLPEMVA